MAFEYVKIRGSNAGPFFCSIIGEPRAAFDQQLHGCLIFSDLDNSRYKGHRFTIGSASHKAEMATLMLILYSVK